MPFEHKKYALVKLFGKVKFCMAKATTEALPLIEAGHVFEGTDELHFIGRGEDYYASPHYRGRIAVQVERGRFISGRLESKDAIEFQKQEAKKVKKEPITIEAVQVIIDYIEGAEDDYEGLTSGHTSVVLAELGELILRATGEYQNVHS